MTAISAARASLTWIVMLLLLSGLTAACGGGPGDGPLKDGAGMSMSVPADAGSPDSDGAPDPNAQPPGGCWNVEQGCHCLDWNAVVSCQTPVYRDGDYTTCAGTRECIRGTWGPCWPPNYQTPGTTTNARPH